MSGYLLSPRAQADIEEIWDYSVDIWGTDRAERYVRDLWERIKYLAARTHLSLNKDCLRAPSDRDHSFQLIATALSD
jgi:toxin ParE1/3/4